MTSIVEAWPSFTDEEIDAVADILRSGKVNYWTGQVGREFERDYAAHTGRRHAIALHNGTLALELALHAFGIGPGDEVITTPRTFIASASAIVMRGAMPVLADIDRDSQNITSETIRKKITPHTRAIIPVHLGGWPCDMPAIMALAEEHDLVVIEDCAQAHGAMIDGRPVGSFGHAAAFSFCQDKIITTGGEGGMLLLDNETAWRKAWAFKDHGKSYEAVYEREHAPGFRWLHESFGTNWRMLEVQAAIGRIQLERLEEMVDIRSRNAGILRDLLKDIPSARIPAPREGVRHAYYRFYAFVEPQNLAEGWTRDRIMQEISGRGVPVSVGSCSEIYREKAFQDSGLAPSERLPTARELGDTSLAFLVHPTITEDQMTEMARVVGEVFKSAME